MTSRRNVANIAIVLASCVAGSHLIAQGTRIAHQSKHDSVAVTLDQKRVEHEAAVQLRKEFDSGRSVGPTIGIVFTADDASGRVIAKPRDHVDDLVNTLGARDVDSLTVIQCQQFKRSRVCRLNGVDVLVRLHPPVVVGDTATLRVEIVYQSIGNPGRGLFITGRTLSFVRRGHGWDYSGDRGRQFST